MGIDNHRKQTRDRGSNQLLYVLLHAFPTLILVVVVNVFIYFLFLSDDGAAFSFLVSTGAVLIVLALVLRVLWDMGMRVIRLEEFLSDFETRLEHGFSDLRNRENSTDQA